jgi:hypothetical protein
MHNLVKSRLRQVLLENIQEADKLYFNSGKLSPEEGLTNKNVECVSVQTLNNLRTQAKSLFNFDLEKSIEQFGIQKPVIVVYHVHDNKAALSDGHHRLDTAIELGLECIPTKVIISGVDAPLNAKSVTEPDWKGKDELKPSEIGLK